MEELISLFERHGPLALSVIVLSYIALKLLRTINNSMKSTAKSIEELSRSIGDLQIIVVGISSLIRSLTGLFMRYPQIAREMVLILKEETDYFKKTHPEGDEEE